MIKYLFPKFYIYFKNSYLYIFAIRFRKNYKPLVVHRDTTIVVEGFPRSANTFFVNLLKIQTPAIEKFRNASHIHSSAQILSGIAKGKPVVLLLRDPRDAITSLIVKHHSKDSIEDMIKWISMYTRYYYLFHNKICEQKNKILILEFEKITKDPNYCLESINTRFGLNFDLIEDKDQKIKEIFGLIRFTNSKRVNYDQKQLAVPSKEKEIFKEILGPKIEADQMYRKVEGLYHYLKN